MSISFTKTFNWFVDGGGVEELERGPYFVTLSWDQILISVSEFVEMPRDKQEIFRQLENVIISAIKDDHPSKIKLSDVFCDLLINQFVSRNILAEIDQRGSSYWCLSPEGKKYVARISK